MYVCMYVCMYVFNRFTDEFYISFHTPLPCVLCDKDDDKPGRPFHPINAKLNGMQSTSKPEIY